MISNPLKAGTKFPGSIITIILIVFSLTASIKAQDTSIANLQDTTYSFWSRHNLAKASVIGLGGGILLYGYAVWWKHDYRSFRWYEEGRGVFDAHLGIDKVGHAYTSYFLFHTMNDILEWGDYPKEDVKSLCYTGFSVLYCSLQ